MPRAVLLALLVVTIACGRTGHAPAWSPPAPPDRSVAATASARDEHAAGEPATVTSGPSPTPRTSVPAVAGERGRVVTVIDGDTFTVQTTRGEVVVRLIGIDAPERGEDGRPAECYFREATATLLTLAPPGSTVLLERDSSDTDRYGRLLRYAWVDRGNGWVLLNEELVRRGAAVAREYPPDVRYAARLAAAQQEARRARAGLWSACSTPAATSTGQNSARPGCDPSYPDICLPSPPPDLDCRDIPHRRFRVLPPDPHRLDSDRDGIGCETG
ncbi:MAG: thermonuclease family protein [Thermomicrobium sp.]|nr:thermonuclease family protein [Thermomicrobium sp.]